MKTKLAQCLIAALLCVGFTANLHAQGTAFTYQGFLTENGAPVHGASDFEFRLFDATSGGTQQGSTVALKDVGITNGVFTVALDFGASPFNGGPRWLDIAVRPVATAGAHTNLSPRQPITSAPYALQAANAAIAATANSVNAANIIGTISSNNIGAGTITTVMLANGAVGSNQLAAGAVTTAALSDGAVTGAKIHSPFTLFSSVTITNPTAFNLDQFGSAVAAVGMNHILVGSPFDDAGATNAGAAHLFDANGNLMLTLANPVPTADDNFGLAVTSVGTDKLLVGAPSDDTGALNTGIAYLFSSTGALLLTLTNPSPATADGFGRAVAGLGPNHFLICSFRDNAGGGQFGAAYLYSLSGSVVRTFTNPAPANLDLFGAAATSVGNDKLLIGAYASDVGAADAGTAYLFSTNGTLLTVITNPTPESADNFGFAVAAVSSDRVLIGAPGDSSGASGAGAAYLYDLGGNLLFTFTNPTPAVFDQFGKTVAAVGADRVVIGAPQDDAGAANAGSAYLFDLSGNLLLTVTNPTPSSSDQFGTAVTALDANRVVVGSLQDDFEVSNAGGVYVLASDFFTPGLIAAGVRAASVDTVDLASSAVTTEKIADGAIQPEDLDLPAFANSFWKTDGNSGTSAASNFIGTTDAVPLVLRAGNRQVLKLEGVPSGTRIIGGVNSSLHSSSTNSSILGGRDGLIEANAHESTIVGGLDNVIRADQRSAFIGGGARNEILLNNQHAVIVGGRDNRIGTNTVISLVVGGAENRIANNVDGGLMVGGFRNDILGSNDPNSRQIAPILIGGSDNEIGQGRGSSWAIILGGDNNRVGTNCPSAVILGGTNNIVADNAGFSLAAGRRARVNHLGAFVMSDSQNLSFASAGDDSFNLRFQGGLHLSGDTSQFFGSTTRQMLNLWSVNYGIGVQSSTMYFRTDSGFSWYQGGVHSNTQNSPGTGGLELMRLNSTGLRVNGTFVSVSDRNAKEDFRPTNPAQVLDKVLALPLQEWVYKTDVERSRHLGPMAQDFHAAFGLGADDKHIATVDADGVALAAIQGLNQKLERENVALKSELAELRRLVEAMNQRLNGVKQ